MRKQICGLCEFDEANTEVLVNKHYYKVCESCKIKIEQGKISQLIVPKPNWFKED